MYSTRSLFPLQRIQNFVFFGVNVVTLTCWGYYQILNISVSLYLSLLLSDVGVNQIAAGLV